MPNLMVKYLVKRTKCVDGPRGGTDSISKPRLRLVELLWILYEYVHTVKRKSILQHFIQHVHIKCTSLKYSIKPWHNFSDKLENLICFSLSWLVKYCRNYSKTLMDYSYYILVILVKQASDTDPFIRVCWDNLTSISGLFSLGKTQVSWSFLLGSLIGVLTRVPCICLI